MLAALCIYRHVPVDTLLYLDLRSCQWLLANSGQRTIAKREVPIGHFFPIVLIQLPTAFGEVKPDHFVFLVQGRDDILVAPTIENEFVHTQSIPHPSGVSMTFGQIIGRIHIRLCNPTKAILHSSKTPDGPL